MLARNNMVMGIPVMAYNMNATFPFVVLKYEKFISRIFVISMFDTNTIAVQKVSENNFTV
jgi:hypothetical protein